MTVLLVLAAAPLAAQTAAKRTPEEIKASYEAHKGDFDYLLGDWEFTADSKDFGKFNGLWSAVRLENGQILDEWRVLDEAGESVYVTSTLRNYNSGMGRWELVGAGAGGGLLDFGTAQKNGDEVHIEQKFGTAGDKPSTWKIRYYNIRPDAFSWSADRSFDEGKTWERNHMTIEARRTGPSRSLPPLTKPRAAK